ncbi:MAG: hypothetical protein HY291_13555 [Planctomycetes bacterium]|nr:hypothetical protein [Planctomycetota bacterium]
MRMMLSILAAAALFCLAGCGDTYKKNGGLPGAIDAGVQADSNSKSRRYEDAEVNFERPAMWTVTTVESKDPNIYALDITGPGSVYARLTIVRESGDPGSFPFEIVQGMRRGNTSMESEPFTTTLASHDARGYKYRLKADGTSWEGLVVSFTQARSEICFLGQFPTEAGEAHRKAITDLMNDLHLKSTVKKAAESKP